MFCDPASCPTAWAGLVIGLLLALFALWFFLRTRVAARLFGGLTAIWRLRAPRPLSRRGLILWVIVSEGLILFGVITPALEQLVSPALAQALGSLGEFSFVVAWVALLLLVVEVDQNLETDQDKDQDKQKE